MSDLFVIDYESLNNIDSAVLLSVGMARFREEWVEELAEDLSPETCKKFYKKMVAEGLHMKFAVANQLSEPYNKTISQDTIDWWKSQGDEARKVTAPNPKIDVPIANMAPAIKKFLDGKKALVYTRGMIDARWYQTTLDSEGIDTAGSDSPIKWWDFRDVRTVISELLQINAGNLPRELKHLVDMGDDFVKHDAMHDAAMDALNIVICRIICHTGMDY